MRESWVETTLDGIAEVVMGQSPDGKTYNQEGIGLPFMQGSAEFGEHNPVPEKWCSEPKKIAESGDLLLSVRAPVGDTNFADQRIAVGRGLSIIRANKESLTEFIRLVIQLNVAELIASSGSGMFASITGKNLKEFKVHLPPLPEQRRIVDLISSVDSYTEALQQQLASTKSSRSAVLYELLTAGGDDWIKTKLGLIAEFVMGQAPLGERCNKEGIGTPFVKAGEFGENRPAIVEWTTDPLKMAKHSDVLVCVVGATAGKINLGADCAIGRSVAAIQPSKKLNQFYLYYLLSLELSNLRSGSRGSAQGVITKDDLYRIPVRLPSIEEQNMTVSIVSSIDNFIDHITSTLKHVRNLRSGLLSDLLSGEHEIPASYDKVIGAA
jgi:restriction endonuclease S subunit